MKINMGIIDRVIRIAVAAVFLVLFLSGQISGMLAIILLLLGAVFALTSAVGLCPLYIPLKVNTKKKVVN